MAEKGCVRKVEPEYSYDRFATRKLSQVYQQLLPDGFIGGKIYEMVGDASETSSDLCPGFFGETERRENHY